MIHGKIYEEDLAFVRLKKHYCPKCNRLLEVDYKESVVDSRSEEASGYDFSLGFANRLAGNISFTVPYFHCANCGADYSVNDIKEAEHKVDSTCNADRSKKQLLVKVISAAVFVIIVILCFVWMFMKR